ncbi:T-complex protein 1 subunit epsilon [Capsicum chinense]|nr:T-complex protein 1 subunit epsilon [Capsicum chinense]
MTTLSSRIVNRYRRRMTEIAVKAFLAVAYLESKDVNPDLIKVEEKVGGKLENTELIYEIVVDKDMSYPKMPKQIRHANIVILTCSFETPKPKIKHKWVFGDKANHLLMNRSLSVVRWVGGVELELIAIATGERIMPRNLIRNNSVVYSGDSVEIFCVINVETAADKHPRVEQFAIRAFADALDFIPIALVENSGLQLIETLSAVKSQQIKKNNPCGGIDCNDARINDMCDQNVFKTLTGKQQQILLTTQKDNDNDIEGSSTEKGVQVTKVSQVKASSKRKKIFEVQDVVGDISIKFEEVATAIDKMVDSCIDVTKLYEVMAMESYEEELLSDAFNYLVQSDTLAKTFMLKN